MLVVFFYLFLLVCFSVYCHLVFLRVDRSWFISVGRTTAICKVMMSNTCKSSDWQRLLLNFKLPYFGLAILLLAQYSNHRVYKHLENTVSKYAKALYVNSWEDIYYGLQTSKLQESIIKERISKHGQICCTIRESIWPFQGKQAHRGNHK